MTEIGTWTQPTRDGAPIEGIWVMACEPEGVNIGLVAGADQVLVVDTGSSPEQGRQIAESVRDLLGRQVDHVVITHAHWDHLWGLAGFDGAESHAHESVEESLAWAGGDEARELREQLNVDASELVAPTHPISLVHALDLGDLRVELLHFGPAHTQGDLLVSIPSRKVWFTGDLLETSGDPQFDATSSIETWPMALDGILGGATDDHRYVPGHGPVATRMDVFEQRANISMLYGAGEQLVRRGVKLDAALKAIDNPLDENGNPRPSASEWEWPFSTETVKAALPKVYAELAAHGMTPRTQLPLLGRM